MPPDVAGTLADPEFDVRSIELGDDPEGGNAPVSTRARAIISGPEYSGNLIGWVRRCLDAVRAGWRRWWMWSDRPPSLRVLWRLTGFDQARVYKGSPALARGWKRRNSTERLLMFLLLLVAPGFAQPLLRWVFASPVRRAGFWLVIAGLTVWRLVLVLLRWMGA